MKSFAARAIEYSLRRMALVEEFINNIQLAKITLWDKHFQGRIKGILYIYTPFSNTTKYQKKCDPFRRPSSGTRRTPIRRGKRGLRFIDGPHDPRVRGHHDNARELVDGSASFVPVSGKFIKNITNE